MSVWMTPGEARTLNDELRALRAELDSYRTLPLVPLAEHNRVCQQRDHYAEQLDGMARVDEVAQAHAERRLRILQAVAGILERATPADSERGVFDALFAEVAEYGERGAAYAKAWEEREARRADI